MTAGQRARAVVRLDEWEHQTLVRAHAAAESTTASYTRILDAATPGQTDKPSRGAADAYRDALTALWLLDPLPTRVPVGSALNRLVAKPKHHLADPPLSARLRSEKRPWCKTPTRSTCTG